MDDATLILALAARAGLTLPADRMPQIIAGYREIRTMAATLRQPRTAAAEPAPIYRLSPGQ